MDADAQRLLGMWTRSSAVALKGRRGGAPIAAGLLIAAVALLFRPYRGLFGDARIYIGQAVAALDPAGVGRDLMFVHDRQSAFSVYPALLTRAVALFGPFTTAAVVSLAALAFWTAAAAGMVSAFVGRRAALLSLLGVLILPVAYSDFRFDVGEASAVPRPVAEALVLLGIWALLRGGRWTAAAPMLAAAAVHPIMAAPGLGVLYVVFCLEDRRWGWLAVVGAAVLAAGAALKLPVLARLTETADAGWLAVLHARSPPLFLRDWSDEVWSQTAARAVTLGLAAWLLRGRSRQIAVAALAVSAAALAVSAVSGDVASSVLVLQAQLWRVLWLLSVLAAAALPLVLIRLWGRSPLARLAAGALLCAWLTTTLAFLSAGAGAASVLLVILSLRNPAPARIWLRIGWALVATSAAVVVVGEGAALWSSTFPVAEPLRQPLHVYLLVDAVRVVVMTAVLAGAAAWERRGREALGLWAVPAAAALLLIAAAGWRSLDGGRRLLESSQATRQVRAFMASRPGEVLWLGGDLQPMLLAGRPAWWSQLQGAGGVFSRDESLIWAARRDRLVATGVGPPTLLERYPYTDPPLLWAPSAARIQAFCAFPDAPAWIVQPVRRGGSAPAGTRLWRSPVPTPRLVRPGGPIELVETFAFLPCR